MHNVSSEGYANDLNTCLDTQQNLSKPISNEGYEIPVTIINNEYLDLELGSDVCEYLDLSRTSTDHKDSELESVPEDIHLLYCNMNPEQL